MLRSTECFASDDVTIRCRVRQSLQTEQREYSTPREMTCTMRVWHRTRTPTPSVVVRKAGVKQPRNFDFTTQGQSMTDHGPELVLTLNEAPIMIHPCCSGDFAEPISMSERFVSFGSGTMDKNGSRSSSRQRPRLPTPLPPVQKEVPGEITIPISDIMVVDVPGGSDLHQCNITTMSRVHYELTMESRNGQDILQAFLRARLPKDRVIEAINHRTSSHLSRNSASTTTRSFDIEAFTAVRMAERMENETISEKLRRKVVRVFSRIEEMSVSISECACGCGKDDVSTGPPLLSEKRDSPPPYYGQLEDAPSDKPERSFTYVSDETILRRGAFKDCQLPSGLSVEDDDEPELETTIL